MNTYITAGELAKLSSTTKRTVLFYDQKGILKPKKINSKGYRFYEQRQVLDYQKILLLSTLGVTLSEMKQYIRKNGNLSKLFDEKKELIQKEINLLEFNLKNLQTFQKNLLENGTLVHPTIKTLKPFGVYYIEREGPYAKIEHYCEELIAMFTTKPSLLTTLSIFDSQDYKPKKSIIKIGVLANKNIQIKKEFENIVRFMTYSPGKVIAHTHNGSGSLLSLFWKELEKYCKLHNVKIRKNKVDFEIYRKVNEDITKQFFEIYIPIF